MLKKLIKTFLKIGAIGFGGGSALVPVIEKEVVDNQKMMDGESYTDYVIVSNITPGALPVKLAQGIGQKLGGIKGGIISSISVTLPGAIICVILLSILSILNHSVLEQIEFFAVGIAAFIIFLILMYINKVLIDSKQNDFYKPSIIILLSSFFLTFGKEIRQVLNIASSGFFKFKAPPIFDVSIVDLLLIVFFIVFFMAENRSKIRLTITILISIFALLVFGKAAVINFYAVKPITYAVLIILSVVGVIINNSSEDGTKRKYHFKKPVWTVVTYLSFIFIFTIIPYFFLGNKGLAYSFKFSISGIISTLTSFGGGEAFLSVAQGVFVDTNIISGDVFYKQIVPIANALPGPILVKILAGIGYVLGFKLSNSIVLGYVFSMLGIAIGVGTSSGVFAIIFMIYNSFKSLSVFKILKTWILPAICGLLLSTVLSMLFEMLRTTEIKHINPIFAIFAFIIIITFNFLLHKKYKINDLYLILLSGIISWTMINLF